MYSEKRPKESDNHPSLRPQMNNEVKQHLHVLATGDFGEPEKKQGKIHSIRRAVGGDKYEELNFPEQLHRIASCTQVPTEKCLPKLCRK